MRMKKFKRILLLAGLLPLIGAAQVVPTWQNLVNITQTADTLQKTSGGSGFNACANSANILIGNGWVKYHVISTGTVRLFGFSQNLTSVTSDAQVLYSFYTNGGSLLIREAGTQVNPSPSVGYTTGDDLLIERTGDTIYYKKNGSLIRKIATTASWELNAAVVMNTSNSRFEHITTSFGIPVNTTAVIVNDVGGHKTGSIDITAGGGTSPYTYSWSPGGQTTQDLTNQYPGTYTITTTDAVSATYVKSYTIAYGAEWENLVNITRTGTTLEKTSGVADFNAHANSTNILVGDGWVQYKVASTGTIRLFGFSQHGTSIVNDAQVKYSFYTNGGSLLIRESGTQVNPSPSVTYTTGDILLIQRTADTIYYKKNGSLIRKIATTASWELNAAVVFYTLNSKFEDITTSFGIPLHATGVITNDIGGHQTGAIDVTPTGGKIPYTYSWAPGGQTTQDLTSQSPGTYTLTVTDSVSTTYGTSFTIQYGAEWEHLTNVTLTGTTLEKTSGANNTWNASANSTNVLIGNGWVKYKVGTYYGTVNTGLRLFGFSQYQTSVTSDAQALYSFYTNGPSIYIRESGTQINPSPSLTYVLGDELLIERTGDTIYYKKNGSLVRKIATTSTWGLNATAVFNTSNAKVEDITTSFGQLIAPSISGTITKNTCLTSSSGAINITVTGTDTPYTYSWGGPSSFSATTEDVSGLINGTYTVTVTGHLASTSQTTFGVTTTSPPTVAVSPSSATICYGASTSLTASGASTYAWSPSTGLSATTGATVTASPTAATTYSVTGTDANGCTNMATVSITVSSPTVTVSSNVTICYGNSTSLTASGATTYVWSPATGLSSSTSATVTANPTATTTYVVTGTSSGCTGTAGVIVTVNPSITVSAGSNQTICSGTSVSIGGSPTASGGTSPYTYAWTASTGLSSTTVANPTASPSSTRNYTVTVTDNAGCTKTSTVAITVNTTPTISISPSTDTICIRDSTTLTASGASTYVWAPATGLSSTTGSTVIAKPTTTRTYTITGTSSGCTGVNTVTIIVSNPIASFTNNISILPPTVEWSKNYGGSDNEVIGDGILQTMDGGYIYVGYSFSSDGDVPGNYGINDYWVVKLDVNGNTQWRKNIGGTGYDGAGTIEQNADGSYTIFGNSSSNDIDFTDFHGGGSDIGIVKLDSYGNILWSKMLGGSGDDNVYRAKKTSDGGYVIVGQTTSSDGDITDTYHGEGDGLVIKIDSIGNIQWQKSLGDSTYDYLTDVVESATGDFVVSGITTPNIVDDQDLWVMKLDSAGTLIWQKIYGGSDHEETRGITKLENGGYAITAGTGSNDGDVGTSNGSYNIWTIKIDESGNIVWKNLFGGSGTDASETVLSDGDGGCIVVGFSNSGDDGISTNGGTDGLIQKINKDGQTEWFRTYGGSFDERFYGIQKTTNGGYIVTSDLYTGTGEVASGRGAEDALIVKFSAPTGPGAGHSLVFTNTSTDASSYQWQINNTNVATTSNLNYTFSTIGTYTVSLIATSDVSCKDTSLLTVKIDPVSTALIADAGIDKAVCSGSTARLGGAPTVYGGTPPYTYSWTPSTGLNNISIANPVANLSSAITYTLSVTDHSGATSTSDVSVTILSAPTVSAGTSQTICSGDSVSIGGSPTASGGTSPYIYVWSPVDSLNNDTIANPTVRPIGTTVYNVIVIDSNSCQGTASVTITVKPEVVAFAGNDTTIFNRDTITIGGTPTASYGTPPYSYSWSPSTALNNDTLANPKASPSSTTTYVVSITDAGGCGTVRDTIIVTVDSLPYVNAGENISICLHDSVTIGGSPTARGGVLPLTYSWTPSTGLSSTTIANPKASPSDTTIYVLVVTDANGYSQTNAMVVTVKPIPTAYAGIDTTIYSGGILLGDSIVASGGVSPYIYNWSPNTNMIVSDIANPFARLTDTTTFYLVVTDSNSCYAYDTVVVNFNNIFGSLCNLDSCTWTIDHLDSANYTVGSGQKLCIRTTGISRGTITLNSGGRICNSGKFEPTTFVFNGGVLTNNFTGTVQVDSSLSFKNGAEFLNDGFVSVSSYIKADSGAIISNSGTIETQGEVIIKTGSTLDNDGVISLNATNFTISDTANVNNYGTFRGVDSLKNYATLSIGYGSRIFTTNYFNYSSGITQKTAADSISSGGGIIVCSITANYGNINDTLDICDKSPSAGPVYLDVNSGTVQSSVTFCQTSFVLSDSSEVCGNCASLAIQSNGCAGDLITFTAVSTKTFDNYEFFHNNVSVQSGSEPFYTLLTPAVEADTFTVVGVAFHSPCKKIIGDTIIIHAKPTISISEAAVGDSVILVASGASTYQWAIVGDTVFSNSSFIKVSPSVTTTYIVYGTNSNGCIGTNTIEVVKSFQTNYIIQNPTFFQPYSGTISSTITGGKLPFTFSWNTGSIEPNLSSIGIGMYHVSITDASGQSATADINVGYSIDFTAIGASVSTNSITKTAEGNTWGSAGSTSYNTISSGQDGWAEFTVTSTGTSYMFGLGTGNNAGGYTDINYAINVESGSLKVYENGSLESTVGTCTTGDIIRVERSGTSILYKKNGTTLYTSSVDPSLALVVNTALYTEGASITGIQGKFTDYSSIIQQTMTTVNGESLCNGDVDRNSFHTINYDEDGNVIAESKVYFDYLGRTIQTQVRSITDNDVIANQTLYDLYGRPVIQSLPAPIGQSDFCYKPDKFFTNSSGANYSNSDFNIADHTKLPNYVAPGEVDNPKPVGNTTPNSLGWYYSNNNYNEAYVPASAFPYTRVAYDDNNNSGDIQRATSAGENLKMGSGHETKTFTMPILNELDHYMTLRPNFISDSPTNTLKYKGTKTINVDENGKEMISFYDMNGNMIATCLSGQVGGSDVLTEQVSLEGSSSGYVDLHVSEGAGNTFNAGAFPAIPIKIIDLQTGKTIYDGPASGMPTSLSPGYYRFIGNFNQYVSPISSSPQPNLGYFICYTCGVAEVFGNGDVKIKWEGYNTDIGANLPGNPSVSDTQVYPVSGTTGPADNTNKYTGHSAYNFHMNLFQYYKITSNSPFTIRTGSSSGMYQVIPSTQAASSSGPLSGAFGYTLNYYDFTYYYYDKANRLVATVAPNGVDLASTAYPEYVSKTEYNSLDWALSTTTTDEGETKYLYREDGQVRFSKNARQKASHATDYLQKFSYINYDDLGRVIETGEYNPVAVQSFYIYYFDQDLVTMDLDPLGASQQTYTLYDVASSPPLSYQQNYLLGKVSKTWNDESETWYSYDELGRVSWTIQRIKNMPTANANTIKTVNYKYDMNGNVTEVAYQKEDTGEDFYHYYEYDGDKRLKKVFTSTDAGLTKQEQSSYSYYKHGPLKRIELANKLQGVDYVYTINGWLKSINNPELNERDPGKDGTSASTSHSAKDLFGTTLDYFAGDYNRAGTYVQTYDTPEKYVPHSYLDPLPPPDDEIAKNLYNGIIKDQRWQTVIPGSSSSVQYMYAYLYDNKYQLTNAKFGGVTSAGTLNKSYSNQGLSSGYHGPTVEDIDDYKIWGITYDRNGNINALNRNAFYNGGTGNVRDMDQLSYTYSANTNKLNKVTDDVTPDTYSDKDFKTGQTDDNYSYNEIGQLTADVNESSYYAYDVYGRVSGVYSNSGHTTPKATFIYDEKGFRIKKTDGTTDTWYIRDASGNVISTYEKPTSGGSITQKEIGIFGDKRLGIYDVASGTYLYELMDQLGNVRSTFASTTETSISTGFAGNETYDYLFTYNPNIDFSTADHSSSGDNASVKLEAQQFGTGIFNVPVKTSQIISGSFYYKVSAGTPNAMLVLAISDLNTNKLLQWESKPVGNSTTWAQITYSYTASVDGLLSCYFWNNDNTELVWFDDLTLNFSGADAGIVKAEAQSATDYYPHGGIMPGHNYVGAASYRYGYQGQFSEKDNETGLNSFELRQYDGRLGRWLSTDPAGQFHSPYLAMGNNPVNNVDPDGGFMNPVLQSTLIWAGIGAIAGTTAALIDKNKNHAAGWIIGGTVSGALIGFGLAETPKKPYDIGPFTFYHRNFHGAQNRMGHINWGYDYTGPRLLLPDFDFHFSVAFRLGNMVMFDFRFNSQNNNPWQMNFPGRWIYGNSNSKYRFSFLYYNWPGNPGSHYSINYLEHGPGCYFGGYTLFHEDKEGETHK